MRFVSPCTVATLAAVGFAMQGNAGDVVAAKPVAAAEAAFLDFLDAHGELAVVESGLQERYLGRDGTQWQALSDARRSRLDEALGRLEPLQLRPADERAVQAMRASLAALASEDAVSNAPATTCKDAGKRDLDYARLRAALVACYVEFGNALRFEDSTIDRGSALQLLHVIDEPARRRAVFDAFVPLWTALDGHGEPDSPYRRMIAMAAEAARKQGSPIDAAARALGVRETDVENWLVEVLDAWRQATGPQLVEPWDYRYVNSAANRELAARIPPESLVPANQRFYQDIGADLAALGVMYDLEPRAGKSPLAYTDFVTRGRATDGRWQVSVARVVATYPTGGLYSLNELVHESGHAVHIAAIHNRPAYMDWPDTLFTEAFADVPSWSVYEPAWQRRYLRAAAAEPASLRALFGDVMLDVAWALFELRLLRDPRQDPNVLWTDITSRYLHVAPHPDVPWWAVRVQLVDEPGYMVNYGLGAVLTAEMRQRTVDVVGAFDAGNPGWYAYLSRQLLQYGSERDTRSLMHDLLGRPVSPAALIRQVARSGDAAPRGRTTRRRRTAVRTSATACTRRDRPGVPCPRGRG